MTLQTCRFTDSYRRAIRALSLVHAEPPWYCYRGCILDIVPTLFACIALCYRVWHAACFLVAVQIAVLCALHTATSPAVRPAIRLACCPVWIDRYPCDSCIPAPLLSECYRVALAQVA